MFPRRILMIAEGQLGDLLLLTPALRAIKSTYPSCFLAVLIVYRRGAVGRAFHPRSPVIGPLEQGAGTPLAGNPHVDNVFILDRFSLRSLKLVRRIAAELAVIRFLRGGGFDTVISTFPEDRFALYAFASGASSRIGQKGQSFSWLFTETPDANKERSGVRGYYLALAGALGACSASDRTEYVVPAEAKRWAGAMLRRAGIQRGERFLVIHPGATGSYKIWPPERFARVAGVLLRSRRMRVAVCYGPEDLRIMGELRTLLPRRVVVIDTGGELSRLAAIMQASSLCLTNDSGPRHLAVAVGAPSLALFRKHHDREWKIYAESRRCATIQAGGVCPVCPPDRCLDRLPPGEAFGGYCVRMIGAEEVVRKINAILRER